MSALRPLIALLLALVVPAWGEAMALPWAHAVPAAGDAPPCHGAPVRSSPGSDATAPPASSVSAPAACPLCAPPAPHVTLDAAAPPVPAVPPVGGSVVLRDRPRAAPPVPPPRA